MTDLIVLFVIAVILGLAAGYIFKAKRKGQKCVGCPYGGKCGGSCDTNL